MDPEAGLVLTDNDHIRRATLDGPGLARRLRDTGRDHLASGALVGGVHAFEPAPPLPPVPAPGVGQAVGVHRPHQGILIIRSA